MGLEERDGTATLTRRSFLPANGEGDGTGFSNAWRVAPNPRVACVEGGETGRVVIWGFLFRITGFSAGLTKVPADPGVLGGLLMGRGVERRLVRGEKFFSSGE